MPVTFTKPKPEVFELLKRVTEDHHPALVEAGVTIGLLAAWSDAEGNAPLKLHGYPCLAIVEKISYKKRCQGLPDAAITLSAALFLNLSEAEQIALLDHELTHLELVRDADGMVKRDDAGRPKLAIRLHDFQAGWFKSVADRHSDHSQEVQQAKQLQDEWGQTLFSWAEGPPLKFRREK